MKCPKCSYLGFETGDRCRNCGYDFSLLSVAEFQPAEYEVHPASIDDVPIHLVDDDNDPAADEALTTDNTSESVLIDSVRLSLAHELPSLGDAPLQFVHEPRPDNGGDARLSIGDEPLLNRVDDVRQSAAFDTPAPDTPEPAPPPAPFSGVTRFAPAASNAGRDPALPLFTPADADDDEPLIKLPVAPRAPLAVRRTPDTPRLRAVPRPQPRPSAGPVLDFPDEDRGTATPAKAERMAGLGVRERAAVEPAERIPAPSAPSLVQPSRAGARMGALLIDYLILLGIDAAVVYFTVRMASLAPNEWRLLPVLPMLTFLCLLKVAYFYAFTALGGQTIGKMAVGTSVVTDEGKPVDAAHAMRRTSAGALSFLLLGLGFVPALFGDGRALHDRLSSTRVVRLRSV
jgi:uncharacterized RDD family membrane protein YckC